MNKKTDSIVIQFRPGEAKPWSATYRGNGHYFNTIDEALAYLAGRKLIRPDRPADTDVFGRIATALERLTNMFEAVTHKAVDGGIYIQVLGEMDTYPHQN